MVRQYPHTILTTGVTDSTRDENGNWIPGTSGAETGQRCRAEVKDGNGYITGQDGSRIDYSWIVYLPLTAMIIHEGAAVTIKDGELTIATDTVKRFHRGQLNARIWL